MNRVVYGAATLLVLVLWAIVGWEIVSAFQKHGLNIFSIEARMEYGDYGFLWYFFVLTLVLSYLYAAAASGSVADLQAHENSVEVRGRRERRASGWIFLVIICPTLLMLGAVTTYFSIKFGWTSNWVPIALVALVAAAMGIMGIQLIRSPDHDLHHTRDRSREMPRMQSDESNYSSYSQVPFYRRQSFFWLMYVILPPVAIGLLLTGDMYYKTKGMVKSFGWLNRVVAGLIAIVWLQQMFKAAFLP